MEQVLIPILEIQKFDLEMIQLMKLKTKLQDELLNLQGILQDLTRRVAIQHGMVTETKMLIRLMEGDLEEIVSALKKLEAQQASVKKLEEFNALTQEMSGKEKQRQHKVQELESLAARLSQEEEQYKSLVQSEASAKENSKALEVEIVEKIQKINEEGRVLKERRDLLVKEADPEVFKIYERLLKSKRDQVVVPIENRACTGCHITLTAQDENLVRRGERIIFCEHCSRIHYWPDSVVSQSPDVSKAPRSRRRRTTKK